MLEIGPIAFAAPWFLAALVALPLIWWLLRATPPAPRRQRFPAIRLLFGLRETEETPARTPWWLLVLRMILAGLVIVALARPIANPEQAFQGSGPVVLFADNGWAAAAGWELRQDAIEAVLGRAERQDKPVLVIATAPTADGRGPVLHGPMTATDARDVAAAIAPQPWPADRKAAVEAVEAAAIEGAASVIWLGDGLDDGASADIGARLQHFGSLTVMGPAAGEAPMVLTPPETTGADLVVTAQRPAAGPEDARWVRASDEDGQTVTRVRLAFAAGAREARAVLDIPAERRNRIARLVLEGQDSAGAVVLLDERWRRRPVGLVSGRSLEMSQPLLSDLYYLERALEPYHDVRRGTIRELVEQGTAIIFLADVGTLTAIETDALARWIEAGGVLARFAGPRLAEGSDDLVPVALRRGGRNFGGVLSWDRPVRLAPFPEDSPFTGLAVPEDVTIRSQILAEPAIDLVDRTWARLSDGTPLVTGTARGEGWLVLVHTTANTDWSTLPLSGLFVEMLRRLTALSEGLAGAVGSELMSPLATLDGRGRLGPAPATARPVAGADWAEASAAPRTPPGYYGAGETRRALNLTAGMAAPEAIGALPAGIARDTYGGGAETDFRPWLFAAALLLALADLLVSLGLRGLLRRPLRPAAAGAAGLLLALAAVPVPGAAQDDDPFSPDSLARRAALDLHLAYVMTGIPEVDDLSHAGLRGLGAVLIERTSVEPETPVGVDVETDELAVHPLLYWPVTPGQPRPSAEAVTRLNTYLRNGGMIVFDTRDQAPAVGAAGQGARLLRRLVDGLDVPSLIPVPEDHVLTRSFYLLADFPGRWQGGQVWVEEHPTVNDGVSSVIVGGNDWAGAWAVDEGGRPLHAVAPGGEAQREQAYRFGVNLVMYALTGNYKADQVHLPAIIERLGL